MRLGLTLGTSDGRDVDVEVVADTGTTLGEVAGAASDAAGQAPPRSQAVWLERHRGPVAAQHTVAEVRLRNGDRLSLRSEDPAARRYGPTGDHVRLQVEAGPDSGLRVPLADGVYRIGRDSSSCQVVLSDQAASGLHCELRVHGENVTVADLGSRNGTVVEGVRIEGAVTLEPGQLVEAGSTLFNVQRHRPGAAASVWNEGRIDFAAKPRTPVALEPTTLRLPQVPRPPGKRRFPLAAAIVPVVLGAVTFLMFRQPYFLLMIAAGPIMVIWSTLEDRAGARKQHADETRRFRETLAGLEHDLGLAHAAETRLRRDAVPSCASLTELAAELGTDLWGRRPVHADFLCLRLGLATLPSLATVEPNDNADADPTLASRARALAERYARCWQVPVVLALPTAAVVGVTGAPHDLDAVGRSLVMQAAALHSPRDLAIVVLVAPGRVDGWEWTKWLPHTEVLAEPPWERTVACTREHTLALFEQLRGLLSSRQQDGDPRRDRRVLLVLGDGLQLSRPSLSGLLAAGPEAGIYALCLEGADHLLPAECRVVARVGDQYRTEFTGGGAQVLAGDLSLRDLVGPGTVPEATADRLGVSDADGAARQIGGLRDTTDAGRSGGLPSQVDLLDLLGISGTSEEALRQRWTLAPQDLFATVGVGETGPLTIDLRRDGPHALVAGTTGAGKSELLQTFVASLAASYPPSRVNFVLVDYKGGAAFKGCTHLPHTVGFVTDLDEHLTMRALTSLNAELRRREHLLASCDAKDLVTMERQHPQQAPANLVIVVDEFATLVKDVPEFVRGVVDVAQRGRSLGVHLVLATQRPAGVVDENIRANTNLRVALRVNDPAESSDVIGLAAAARLPRSVPGRGFARLGPTDVREFQAAYVGGHRRRAATPQVSARLFPFGPGSDAPEEDPAAASHAAGSDLDDIVASARAAHERAGLPVPPRPWLPPLPAAVDLADLEAGGGTPGGLTFVVGVADLPQQQSQLPWTLDLDAVGNVLVFGAGGAGKTTLLRTVAASASRAWSADDLHVYALDFASRGLGTLRALPNCGGVVFGDEQERVERLFTVLEREIERRAVLLGAAGSASLTDFRSSGAERDPPPYVLVLLDGFSGFAAAYEKVDYGDTVERFARLVADGRAVGIHFVIATDRRSGLPGALFSVVAGRVVLRMADADDAFSLGVKAAGAGDLPAGRGFTESGLEVQVAIVGADPSGEGQNAAVEALGRRLSETRVTARPVPDVRLLPTVLRRADLPAPSSAGPYQSCVGVSGSTMEPVAVDLREHPVVLVAGNARSGKTTALATVSSGFLDTTPGVQAYLLAPRRSSLVDAAPWKDVARGMEACDSLAATLAEEVERRRTATEGGGDAVPPLLVVVDDADELTEAQCVNDLEQVLRRGRDVGVHMLVAGIPHVLLRAYAGWFNEVRRASCALLLQATEASFDLLQLRMPRRMPNVMPPGRAFLALRGSLELVQVAC